MLSLRWAWLVLPHECHYRIHGNLYTILERGKFSFLEMYYFPQALWKHSCDYSQDLPYLPEIPSMLVHFALIRNHMSSGRIPPDQKIIRPVFNHFHRWTLPSTTHWLQDLPTTMPITIVSKMSSALEKAPKWLSSHLYHSQKTLHKKLSTIWFGIKVLCSDIKWIRPVNNSLKQMDITLNNTLVTRSANNYAYNGYFENVPSFGKSAKMTKH